MLMDLPAHVYAISTLSKALENRQGPIRETYIHTHPGVCAQEQPKEREITCVFETTIGGREGCKNEPPMW